MGTHKSGSFMVSLTCEQVNSSQLSSKAEHRLTWDYLEDDDFFNNGHNKIIANYAIFS